MRCKSPSWGGGSADLITIVQHTSEPSLIANKCIDFIWWSKLEKHNKSNKWSLQYSAGKGWAKDTMGLQVHLGLGNRTHKKYYKDFINIFFENDDMINLWPMAMGYVILPQRMIPMMWLCVTEARYSIWTCDGWWAVSEQQCNCPCPGLQHCYNDVMFPWSL